jgi:hypothetical protein
VRLCYSCQSPYNRKSRNGRVPIGTKEGGETGFSKKLERRLISSDEARHTSVERLHIELVIAGKGT